MLYKQENCLAFPDGQCINELRMDIYHITLWEIESISRETSSWNYCNDDISNRLVKTSL